jgi:hypothetical protein
VLNGAVEGNRPRRASQQIVGLPSSVKRRRSDDGDADGVPGLDQLVDDLGEHLAAGGHGRVGEALEVGVALHQPGDAGGVEPDGQRLLPREAADGDGELGERLVRDAAVGVHATIVGRRVDEVLHVGRLPVTTDLGVVVGGAGVAHVAQSATLDALGEDARADQPAVLVDAELEDPLAQTHAEDVGEALVERAGLAVVLQAAGVLGDAVEHLVPDHIEQDERREDDTVTVAVRHLAGVPEGVVVALTVVHGTDQVHAQAVDGITTEDDLEEVAHHAVEVVGVVDDLVGRRRVTFAANLGAGQALGVLGVVDDALGVLERLLERDLLLTLGPESLGLDQRVEVSTVAGGVGQVEKHVGRDNSLSGAVHDSFLLDTVTKPVLITLDTTRKIQLTTAASCSNLQRALLIRHEAKINNAHKA